MRTEVLLFAVFCNLYFDSHSHTLHSSDIAYLSYYSPPHIRPMHEIGP